MRSGLPLRTSRNSFYAQDDASFFSRRKVLTAQSVAWVCAALRRVRSVKRNGHELNHFDETAEQRISGLLPCADSSATV